MNKQQIIAVILVGIGLLAGSVLVYKNQQSRSRSGNREGSGSISFQKGSNFGDVNTIDMVIATGDLKTGNENSISSIAIKAKLGEANQDLTFINELQEPVSGLILSDFFENSGEWLFPINKIYEDDGTSRRVC